MKTAETTLEEKGYDKHEIAKSILPELDAKVRELYNVQNHPLHLWEEYAIGDANEEEVLADANRIAVDKYRDLDNLFYRMNKCLNEWAGSYPDRYTLSEEDLRDVLIEQIKYAADFDFQTGWRIPIFLHEDGHLEAGEWLSNNSYQPGLIEIISVEPWDTSLFTEENPDMTKGDVVDFFADEFADNYIKELKRKEKKEKYINDNYEIVFIA